MVTRRNKNAVITLWILKVLVGLAFLAAGSSKLAGATPMVAVFAKIGFGQWFRILTGLLEVVGAVGLFVPRWTASAATLLAAVMVGAIGFHLTMLGGNPLPPIVLFILATLIFWLHKGNPDAEAQSA